MRCPPLTSTDRRHGTGRKTQRSARTRRSLPEGEPRRRTRRYLYLHRADSRRQTNGARIGLITAICGRSAIAATTAAVEKVVLRHLRHQLVALGASDPPATVAISAIVADEQHHHDRSEALAKTGRFWPKVIAPVVTASTEFVIWTGMRL